MQIRPKAVGLLSGGLDSTTAFAAVIDEGSQPPYQIHPEVSS